MGDQGSGGGTGTHPPGGQSVRCPLWCRCPRAVTGPVCPVGCTCCSPQTVWGGTSHCSEGTGGLSHLLTPSCTPKPNGLSPCSGARLGSWAVPCCGGATRA